MKKKLSIGLVLTVLVGLCGTGIANAANSNAPAQNKNNYTPQAKRGQRDPVVSQNKRQLPTLSDRKAAASRLKLAHNAERAKHQAQLTGKAQKGGV
jgi:hypothetical protein